jgi:hypothetical protein
MEGISLSGLPQASYTLKENAVVKVGDVNSVLIREKTGNNQAKVILKGQEMTVQFEGGVPAGDRALVEITQQNEAGNITVKQVSSQTPQAEDMLKKAGLELNTQPELKAAIDLILSQGGTISKETVAVLQDFLKNESGSVAQKLDTVKIMQQKNIEFTKMQLHYVHSALHGEPLIKTVSNLLDGPIEVQAKLPIKDQVQQVREAVQKEPDLEKAIAVMKGKLLKRPELSSDFKRVLEKGISEATRFAVNGQPALGKGTIVQAIVTVEKQLKTQIERQPEETPSQPQVTLKSAIGQTLSQINPKSVNQVLSLIDQVKDQQVVGDIKKAVQIMQAGKQRILQAVENSQLPDSIKESVKQESDLSKIINILKTAEIPSDLKEKLTQASEEAVKLENIGTNRVETALNALLSQSSEPLQAETTDSVNIQSVIKLIQKEPSITKVLEEVKRLLAESPGLDELTTAFEKATQLTNQGRELAARKELASAINHLAEAQPSNKNTEMTLSDSEQFLINETLQSLGLGSKDVLVTQITKKLSQLAIDFKKERQEISRNLDSASRLLEGNKPASAVSAKQMLEASIKKLDQAILKGDYMLYTDMSTEKKMLTASSKLSEAKNLLTRGKMAEASQIVKEVKSVMDELVFKPANSKVMHLTKETELLSPKLMLDQAIHHEPGARQIFETIKALGITHEKDAAQALIDKQEAPNNLKETLLKMMETSDGQTKLAVEQALATITGQQLLNKQDASSMQNLFFQLPILLNKQAENVKVYVNSQKNGEKIDWENCNLYFVLETKKLGEVGIMVSAVNRNLSITFKNDREELPKTFEPLTEVTKERLQEIGYHVGAIQIKPLTETSGSDRNTDQKQTVFTPAYTEKGYDFSI